MKILITGVAGFIGFHLASHLLKENKNIVGIDSLNNYYDVDLKKERLTILKENGLIFHQIDILDQTLLTSFVVDNKFDIIVHLAAQAGVRYSIINPKTYIDTNINGFFNILECCRKVNIKHLIYASSSSVYGSNLEIPFEEKQNVNCPQNLYAVSKRSNELMAYSYSNLFKFPSTGLRFFTVYGPWGRPDMAYFKFTKNIFEGKPIDVYGKGNMYRDFTYIDDVVDAIYKIIKKGIKNSDNYKQQQNFSNNHYYEIYNIGNSKPENIKNFIEILEKNIKIKAKQKLKKMQPGDMKATSANIEKIQNYIDFNPRTTIEVGLKKFVDWYRCFYKIK